jgi:hypothetical protein
MMMLAKGACGSRFVHRHEANEIFSPGFHFQLSTAPAIIASSAGARRAVGCAAPIRQP